jgi:hypothetical protein
LKLRFLGKTQKKTSGMADVILFDWDDTLFFTTTLESLHASHCRSLRQLDHYRKLSPKRLIGGYHASTLYDLIKAYECFLALALEELMDMSAVAIVTNSLDGWVHQSATAWLPALVPILSKCMIISARSCYDHEWKTSKILRPWIPQKEQTMWKTAAFCKVLENLEAARLRKKFRIVSIGDGKSEELALRRLEKQHACTAIVLKREPRIEHLALQIIHCMKLLKDGVPQKRKIKFG